MLMPKKVKHRKWQKGRRRNEGIVHRGDRLAFGAFGLKEEKFGSEFFPINRLPKKVWKCRWARARDQLIILLCRLSRGGLCLKWMAWE